MNLNDLAPYAHGERQTHRFTSASSTVFLADLMAPVRDDGIGLNGFGMDDVAVKLAANDFTVTLFTLPDLTPWIQGVLIVAETTDVAVDGWQAISSWDGLPHRFCLDSGVAVLSTAETFEELRAIRNAPERFEAGPRVMSVTVEAATDHIYFYADVNCHNCWGHGDPAGFDAVYFDLRVYPDR